jgi:acyl-CoA synthetase (NDP forming)
MSPPSLDPLFRPRSVAIVGASAREHAIGHCVIANLQAFGFRGQIYPVHPTATQIRGLPAYPSLKAIPGPVDVAHIVIPSALVPQAMAECGAKGVKAVIINSAGFKETGPEGERLQQQFLAEARRHGIRVMGPNCQGIINTDPDVRAYCNFTNTLPRPGTISLAALSGGVGGFILQGLADNGVGVRMYASNGNACDVSIADIVRYWGDDAGTGAIVVYTEGFADPKAFLDVARDVAARKPVLAMKAGRTEQGAKAAASHTGALAGVERATEAIFDAAGILAFADEGELVRAAMAFATQPVPRGPRVGILTNTGGPAVIATDALVAAGLEVPPLGEASIARLRDSLLPQAAVENPVDVIATAGAEHFRAALEVLLDDDGIDAVYLNFVTPSFTDTHAIAREIVAASAQRRKPIVCNFMTDLAQPRFRETQGLLQQGGVPCYAYPTEAARALAALDRYRRLRARPAAAPRVHADVDPARAGAIVAHALAQHRETLSADEAARLFACYGIPVAEWEMADDADAAAEAATRLGYPVVVKFDSAAASHKSDVGGVALGLGDAASVRAAVEDMQARLADLGPARFLVQRHVAGGQELIVGATRSGELGHLLMVGLGGIHVEVLKDVVFALAPVSAPQALSMLASLRAAALLDGVRGQPAADKAAIADLIERVGRLLGDFPIVEELDLNPVLALARGACALDARVRLGTRPTFDSKSRIDAE